MKIILLISLCQIITVQVHAQKMDSVKLANEAKTAKIDSFKNALDSLFAIEEYGEIIKICSRVDEANYANIKKMNLIVSYFMLGDTSRSNQLIKNRISNFSDSVNACADAVYYQLQSDNLSWRYFQHIPSSKKHIDSILKSIYKMENITEPKYGMRLLTFFITDQYVREQLDYYKPLDKRRVIPKLFAPDTLLLNTKWKNNLDSVYDLYQQSGRIFTHQEIGSIDFEQFLLFAHETDLNRRKYYLKLIKEGVQKKVCIPDRIISFILRTEYLKGSDSNRYFEDLAPKIDSLKKEYHVPNYKFSIF